MNDQPIVSLIIPAYQAEKTIGRTLESATSWKGDGLEIIVVDDGSTDLTTTLLHDAASQDDRIVLVSQANKGRSAARNAGIACAKARWVMFLDSDDLLMPGWDDTVKQTANAKGDLLVFSYRYGYTQISLEGRSDSGSPVEDACIDSSEMKQFLIDGSFPNGINNPRLYEWNSCWARLYRNETVQKIMELTSGEPFPLGIRFSEDRIFNLTFVSNMEDPSIRFFSNILYYWDLGSSSTVSSIRPQDARTVIPFSSAVARLQLDKESAGKLLAAEVLARFRTTSRLPASQLPKAAKTWGDLLSTHEISHSIPFIPRIQEGRLWVNRLPVFGITHNLRFLALLYWHVVYKLVDLIGAPKK